MRLPIYAALGCALMMSAGPAWTQGAPGVISAQDPAGVAAAMRYAGYPAVITKDALGDPMIETEYAGYKGTVLFYGCDTQTHSGCDALQLSVGLDRSAPLDNAAVSGFMRKQRFASVFLDDEGDPWIQFDIVTLGGIPAPVFLKALDLYSWSLTAIADEVFSD
ncbi:YbjN domain-containing protein [Porphyrobacter sp. GA68]|uniref:YbjN domain-containing protein n=1 Tax=Porphyrobacter sp. GA68 TaxID=2883480 RepID=UPI001D18E7C4|nr:YbjN domain-containing protein [Porphyrobacter sp. GA68]